MVTFDETEGILFSGDAFGCFGALNGGCIDRNINTDIYWNEMRRYYANIVGKFGNPYRKLYRNVEDCLSRQSVRLMDRYGKNAFRKW